MGYKRKILSIDGGGIRGIIPAILLAEIEKLTQKNIAELFDLIAGTSTGGILTLGLTKPHPQDPSTPQFNAEELINFYREYGKEIFSEPFLDRLTSLDEYLSPKYPAKYKDRVLDQLLGDVPLRNALKEVLLTSYDIDNRFPVFFTNDPRKEEKHSRSYRKICNGFTLKQAAMATSAAPTYFEPYRIPISTHTTHNGAYVLVDGGVLANNPTALSIIEMISTYRMDAESKGLSQTGLPIDQILVVSLGTGALTRSYRFEQAKNWGILGWIQPLINITLDGTSEVVAVQLDQLLSPTQLYRFQGFLDQGKGCDELDRADEQNIAELESLAQSILNENQQEIEQLCQILLEPPA